MNPLPPPIQPGPLAPFEALGATAGDGMLKLIETGFELAMRIVWEAGLAILREAFLLVDKFSIFTVSTTDGPVGALWPLMLWISGVLAISLFFWQILSTALRGGRGFVRLMTGPFQYAAALAVSVGLVTASLTAADSLTTATLNSSLQTSNFTDALNASGLLDAGSDGVKGTVLGIAAVAGVIPAGLGFATEMIFREAAMYVLIATLPVTAAGLLANVTSRMFWRMVRWAHALIAMKPAIATTVGLGVSATAEAEGLSGLFAGVAVLWTSVWVPFVLFRLFAFIDPNTDAGAAFREALSQETGFGSYGSESPTGQAAESAWNRHKKAKSGDDEDDDNTSERANTDRFDSADTGDSIPEDRHPDDGSEAKGQTSSDSDESQANGVPEGDDTDDTGASPEGVDDSRGEASMPTPLDNEHGADVTPDAASSTADAEVDDDDDDDGTAERAAMGGA
ncbi:hypothetical protein L3Q67_01800 [Saccharothrix sp. AJ9571]|nr:hypothetical protein L3Q67_01800 [Saccharothrix sp. AJ9571]